MPHDFWSSQSKQHLGSTLWSQRISWIETWKIQKSPWCEHVGADLFIMSTAPTFLRVCRAFPLIFPLRNTPAALASTLPQRESGGVPQPWRARPRIFCGAPEKTFIIGKEIHENKQPPHISWLLQLNVVASVRGPDNVAAILHRKLKDKLAHWRCLSRKTWESQSMMMSQLWICPPGATLLLDFLIWMRIKPFMGRMKW